MNKEELEIKVFLLTESLKKMIKGVIKKPVRVSKCCYFETDVVGGGYDGEDIVPVVELCKNCHEECNTIEIKPDGWVDIKEEIPF